MKLKRGVGINHCHEKVRKQGGNYALASVTYVMYLMVS